MNLTREFCLEKKMNNCKELVLCSTQNTWLGLQHYEQIKEINHKTRAKFWTLPAMLGFTPLIFKSQECFERGEGNVSGFESNYYLTSSTEV